MRLDTATVKHVHITHANRDATLCLLTLCTLGMLLGARSRNINNNREKCL